MNGNWAKRTLLLCLMAQASSTTPAWAQSAITDLGTLGGATSYAFAVSADGSIVAGESAVGGGWHAVRWDTAGGAADLGTLGGTRSSVGGVSADGSVLVGYAYTAGDAAYRAFRWTSGGGMVDLGSLGGSNSTANGVSADGSIVVGFSHLAGDVDWHAFRWTSGGGMTDLGTLGGRYSSAESISADGSVVVGGATTAGEAAYHAFRWSGGGMADLGTLGGTNSEAYGSSADGQVVVGKAQIVGDAVYHAFRWTSSGMTDLGTLGGSSSTANGISASGSVVVGGAWTAGDAAQRAFRWTAVSGMQTVEDWLRTAGVGVPADITAEAYATNSDGSVIVGRLASNHAFVARVAGIGSGLVTLDDVRRSLAGAAAGGNAALTATDLVLNGAHGRPLSRRVAERSNTYWLAGDWGRDDHGGRHGDIGLAEFGLGRNFGAVQIDISLGQTWAKQERAMGGQTKIDGTYLLAEALVPVSGNLWAVAGAYVHKGEADFRRGYLNSGTQDYSRATPGVDTWALRGRLEWDMAFATGGFGFSPYADLGYSQTEVEAYTETGGGFPARFSSRREKATELRLGANLLKPLGNGIDLVGTLEAAHRFERNGARTTGELIGLFDFSLEGEKNRRDWVRAGIGLQGALAGGSVSLVLNVTTRGEAPNAWVAANWQRSF